MASTVHQIDEAKALIKQKKYKQAYALLKILAPSNPEAKNLQKKVAVRIKKIKYLQRAKNLIEQGNDDEARSILEKLAPTVPAARSMLDNLGGKSQKRSTKQHPKANSASKAAKIEKGLNVLPDNVVRLSQYHIDENTELSHPRYRPSDLPQLIEENFIREQFMLPRWLTPDKLTANLELVYIPFRYIDVSARAPWRAEIPQHKYKNVTEWKTCGTCGGNGYYQNNRTGNLTDHCGTCSGKGRYKERVEKRDTTWHKRTGKSDVTIHEAFTKPVKYNLLLPSKIETPPQPGRIVSPGQPVSNSAEDIQIIPATFKKVEKARKDIQRRLKRKLKEEARNSAREMNGEYRRFKLHDIIYSVDEHTIFIWLCPVYVGAYKFGFGQKKVQINAITGEVSVQLPGYTRALQILYVILFWTAIIGGIYLLYQYFFAS